MHSNENIPEPEKRRPYTLFKPRTKKANFVLSVLAAAVKLGALLLVMAALAGGGAVLGIVKAYMETAPTLDLAHFDDQAQTSFIYDSAGNLITTYKGTEDRVLVGIDEIPAMLQHAFVAVEDARFYTHNGVDVKRIIGAFVNNFTSSSTQGGSTITQQLIKKRLLSDEQSYKRTIQEAYLAMQLESRYTKDQILESYMNTIYLGESYYGVKTAAMGFFGKELRDLTVRECAMLAGLTRSPYYYNPRRNFYTRATETNNSAKITNDRTDYVLRSMYENQFITHEQYLAALSPTTAAVLEKAPGSDKAVYDYAYYVEYALYDVVTEMLKLYQLDDTTANRNKIHSELRTGGYSVYLCIDPQIQTIVEDTLANWKDYPRLRDPSDRIYEARNADGTYTEIEQPQAAAVVVDYRTGELKAVVGGRYPPTQRLTLNRAWEMRMPVGSSIKPLSVYAPALEMGASPASIVFNMPVPIPGWLDANRKDSYPQNYGGGSYAGPETMRYALRQSHNTAAAQALMQYVGVDNSYAFLRKMGVADRNINKDGFGLALGSSGITPVQMAVAFGTIANSGVYQQPLSFSRVVDSAGNVILDMSISQERDRVFSPGTCWMVTDMLKEAVARGTGTKAKISGQTVAGKTGTNSDYKGVFFAGMTGWYSASVWVGHDNYKALSSSATGGDYAAPLWKAFMASIHTEKQLPDRDIIEANPSDLGLVRLTTCGVSGLLATDACKHDANGYATVTDWWPQNTAPNAYCTMHQDMNICVETGLLATEFCPNVQPKGAVFIPYGHPLYNYVESYAKTMERYLGPFATVRLSNNATENAYILQQLTCTTHTHDWSQVYQYEQQQQQSQDALYGTAQALVSQAYVLLTNRGWELSEANYQAVSGAIMQVEHFLYTEYNASLLATALENLNNALRLFP